MNAYDRQNPLRVSSSLLAGLDMVEKHLSIDLKPSLQKVGLEYKVIENSDGYVHFHQFVDFLNEASTRFNGAPIGFLLAKKQGIRNFGQLTLLVKSAPTIGRGIALAMEHGLLYSEQSAWDLEVSNGYASMNRRDRVVYSGSLIQLHEYAITSTYSALRDLAGKNWRASSISFSHSKPSSIELYSRFFEATLHFDQTVNAIVFPEQDLDRKIPTADPQLLKIVQSHLNSLLIAVKSSHSVSAKVELHIRRTLGVNNCNLDSVSELLGHTPRSLQRALKKENSSFRQLLNDVRISVAQHYLRDSNMSLTELADLLGYRNVSAFSRAFKTCTNYAPHDWRNLNTLG